MPMEDAYKLAYEIARKNLVACDPSEVAELSGVEYIKESDNKGYFKLRCLGKDYRITYPEIEMTEFESDAPPKTDIKLVSLHYLITADGLPLTGRWITYRQIPEGLTYNSAFQRRAEKPLVEAFEKNPEYFLSAGEILGGIRSNYGDYAFLLPVLPRLPLLYILWLGDEELPSEARVLFDSTARNYLPAEDLAVIGGRATRELIRLLENR